MVEFEKAMWWGSPLKGWQVEPIVGADKGVLRLLV